MAESVSTGSWVEIERIVLKPGERAPQVPDDTACRPLELRVKGFLLETAAPGDEAEITTAAGRRLRGRLLGPAPAHDHGFGPPVPELLPIAAELRALLASARGAK